MRRFAVLGLLMWVLPVFAGSVQEIRLGKLEQGSRLVFDLDTRVQHTIRTLADPHRLVIDLKDTTTRAAMPQPTGHALVAGVRSGIREGTDLRVVLDLKSAVQPSSYFLAPKAGRSLRLVVDVRPVAQGIKAQPTASTPAPHRDARNMAYRDIVIAVDAGHGGTDPGARGATGTREKDVVLSIARRLVELINAEPGMRGVLTRNGDYYLGLRERMVRARKQQADLFVSIHADAFKKRSVKGSSVFTLSSRGASDEAARWLARRENSADTSFVGGLNLDDKDRMLAGFLMDLSQSATAKASREVANEVLAAMGRIGPTHTGKVQHARFVVLKSPDIPSILVETAYISNRKEERRLRSAAYQKKIANSILSGVRNYFLRTRPDYARVAKRTHVIARGDTLGGIAQRYQVSLNQLRLANNLNSNTIHTGQVLTIPQL